MGSDFPQNIDWLVLWGGMGMRMRERGKVVRYLGGKSFGITHALFSGTKKAFNFEFGNRRGFPRKFSRRMSHDCCSNQKKKKKKKKKERGDLIALAQSQRRHTTRCGINFQRRPTFRFPETFFRKKTNGIHTTPLETKIDSWNFPPLSQRGGRGKAR